MITAQDIYDALLEQRGGWDGLYLCQDPSLRMVTVDGTINCETIATFLNKHAKVSELRAAGPEMSGAR